ncbi:hypothetical protein FOZ63_021685, partial [Perkinsus olseni]
YPSEVGLSSGIDATVEAAQVGSRAKGPSVFDWGQELSLGNAVVGKPAGGSTMTEAEDATAAATACSSPCRGSHTSSDNIESDPDEHFGFFVSLAQSQPESEEVDDGVVDEESLIEYADQHGDPEKADVHVGIFSAGATSFGYHQARLMQTRLAGIIMKEPSKPSWETLLE